MMNEDSKSESKQLRFQLPLKESEKKEKVSKKTKSSPAPEQQAKDQEPRNKEHAEEMSEKQTTQKSRDFEASLNELDQIVSQLEGEVKLEEALQLFDRGMKLSQECEDFLKSAEQKIEILKRAANGSLSTENFSEEALPNQV